MSAGRPSPRPSDLGVGESGIRRSREAEIAGAEPAAQTKLPSLEEFVVDALTGGLMYGAGTATPLGLLALTSTTA